MASSSITLALVMVAILLGAAGLLLGIRPLVSSIDGMTGSFSMNANSPLTVSDIGGIITYSCPTCATGAGSLVNVFTSLNKTTSGSTVTLGINLAHSNTWTAIQTINSGMGNLILGGSLTNPTAPSIALSTDGGDFIAAVGSPNDWFRFYAGGTEHFRIDPTTCGCVTPVQDSVSSLGTSSQRWTNVFSNLFSVYAASGAANPTTQVGSNVLKFGAGGASPLDSEFYTDSTASFDLQAVSGNNVAASLNMLPQGSATGGFVQIWHLASDANPTAVLEDAAIHFGAGGSSATDMSIFRSSGYYSTEVTFQSLASNHLTEVGIAPSGSSSESELILYGSSTIGNDPTLQINDRLGSGTWTIFPRGASGTTLWPLSIGVTKSGVGYVEAMQITTTPNIQSDVSVIFSGNNGLFSSSDIEIYSATGAGRLGFNVPTSGVFEWDGHGSTLLTLTSSVLQTAVPMTFNTGTLGSYDNTRFGIYTSGTNPVFNMATNTATNLYFNWDGANYLYFNGTKMLPATDNTYSLGDPTFRFHLVRAVTITSGDFNFWPNPCGVPTAQVGCNRSPLYTLTEDLSGKGLIFENHVTNSNSTLAMLNTDGTLSPQLQQAINQGIQSGAITVSAQTVTMTSTETITTTSTVTAPPTVQGP